jgi:hypothetical protein
MIKFLLVLFFLGGSVFAFFGFISPRYTATQGLRGEQQELVAASEKMTVLNEARTELVSRYNTFSSEDLDRVGKALPDNVDNIKLVRDIDGIASRHDLSVRNVAVEITGDLPGTISTGDETYGTVLVTFSVACSYETFLVFLADLERSLRILDVVNIMFSSAEDDTYQYVISFKTYWLK